MKSAYPQTQNPVSIRLYANIPFDNTYEHHSLISEWFKYNGSKIYDKAGVTACESFIDRKKYALTPNPPFYYPRWDMTDTYNFDFQNGLVGSVTLELTPEQTNANYMRVTCGSDVYYYFITGIKQVNFETYTLTLELDVIMTYQDEFLEGVKDIPMMTDRKHCHRYTNDGITPHCADFKTGESVFAGIKPSHLVQQSALTPTKFSNLRIKWLYVCVDAEYIWTDAYDIVGFSESQIKELREKGSYTYNGVTHPLCMICIPLDASEVNFTWTFESEGVVYHRTFTLKRDTMMKVIKSLVADGKVHGTKVSYYPPFNLTTETITKSGDVYTIGDIDVTQEFWGWHWKNNKTDIHFVVKPETPYPQYDDILFLHILEEYRDAYAYNDVTLSMNNSSAPSITKNRYTDPKLLFEPFKKYVLTATYSEGNEFFPELIYSDGVYSSGAFKFQTIFNTYIGDYSIFTYQAQLKDANNEYFYNYFKDNNIGMSSAVNYVIPAGTNALDVFNSTQAQSFYTSKVASGITSGLSVAGGIGSIIIGAGMTAGSSGALTPMGMGMVAGGVTAIAGGLASGVETIKSTNAKIEDLKNTPDSINVAGGSFVGDNSKNDFLAYIVQYECSDVIKEKANDFFYNYGYQVARDCYFNTELKYNNDVAHSVDNNLLGRTIFNYVKLNEDITNKINANIPQVVKQKLSQVFNKGITLWSFFGCDALWNDNNLTALNDPDLWFMKHNLDNTEYQG